MAEPHPVQRKPFAVILFDCDGRYSVVPSTWINSTGDVSKWPPKSAKNVEALVQDPVSEPQKNWKDYKITLIKYYSKSV